MFRISLKLIGIIGAVLILAAFIFLPWVEVAPMADLDPLLKQSVGTVVDLLQRVAPPELQVIIGTLKEFTALSGWELVSSNLANPLVRFVLVPVPSLLALVVLVWNGVFMFKRWESLDWYIVMAQIVLAGGLLALLVLNMPSIERMGLGGSYFIDILMATLGARLGWGFWATLGGLAVLLIAGCIDLGLHVKESVSPRKGQYGYSPSRSPYAR